MSAFWKWLNKGYTKICIFLFGATITAILAKSWGVSEDEVHTILLAISLFLLSGSLVVNVVLWRKLHKAVTHV